MTFDIVNDCLYAWRLTSREFLARYSQILPDGATVEFKTDNKGLFEFSLEEVNESEGWKLVAHTFDLHHQEDMMEGNVMTEYEEKFSSVGNPICKLIAVFHEWAVCYWNIEVYMYNRKVWNVWRTGRYSSCLLHVFFNLTYNIGRFAFRDGFLWHKKDATAAYMRLWHSSFMNTGAWMAASAKSAKVRMNYAKYWIACRRQNRKIRKKRKKNKKT